jgi:hypothetical protein
MSKCPICNSRKGKRQCLITKSLVCSLCCGTSRQANLCSGCIYYQKPKRKYSDVPAYSVQQMDGNATFENYSNIIESALCQYDLKNDSKLVDSDTLRIIECLINRYYFEDQEIDETNKLIIDGFYFVDKAIQEELKEVTHEIITKILGVIYFVAKRRTQGGREYINFIRQYVGIHVVPGMRIIKSIF